jgi:hypothetical protein
MGYTHITAIKRNFYVYIMIVMNFGRVLISISIFLSSLECSGCSGFVRCHGHDHLIVGELYGRLGRGILNILGQQGVTPFKSGDVFANFVCSWVMLILFSQGKAHLDGLELGDSGNRELVAINLDNNVRLG